MVEVSVVVPTCQRPQLLERCLTALSQQTLSTSRFEVIVCDDAASRETEHQVIRLGETLRMPLSYCTTAGFQGPATARNTAALRARGWALAFTDDDCVPDSAWLAQGLAALSSEGVAAVTGRTIVPVPSRPTDYQANEQGLERSEFITANCFVRREVFEKLGGFDERFKVAWREDSDLHFRLLDGDHRIEREPRAVVIHPTRPARWAVSLFQQRKSEYDILLRTKHPALYREKIRPYRIRYYVATAALGLAATSIALSTATLLAQGALAVWSGITLQFFFRRMAGRTRAPLHVLEMLVTSALIPPVSVYWRLRGMYRFRPRNPASCKDQPRLSLS